MRTNFRSPSRPPSRRCTKCNNGQRKKKNISAGNYNTNTGFYTIPRDGDYYIWSNITVKSYSAANNERVFTFSIMKNDFEKISTSQIQFPVDNSPDEQGTVNLSTLRTLESIDTISVRFDSGDTDNNNVVKADAMSNFMVMSVD